MIYAKSENLKNKIIGELKQKGEEITPENLMNICNLNKISFGYLRHDEDDSIYLIHNEDLIYLDSFAEPVKTDGSYRKYEDINAGVTELENKMSKDIQTILNGNLDILCLGEI